MTVITLNAKICMSHLLLKDTFDRFSFLEGEITTFNKEHQISTFHPEEISGLYLNFHYDGSVLQCITGISMKTFYMDKTLEKEWDSYAEEFFKKSGIEQELS